jgi:hypothetical protein
MPENPPESHDKPAPEPEKPEGAKPIAPTPRQSAASGDRMAPAATPPPDATAINQHLMSVLAQALGGQASAAAPVAKDDRGLISREEKRFRRAGGTGRPDGPADGKPDAATDKPVEPIEGVPKSSTAEPVTEKSGAVSAEPVESTGRRPRFTRDTPTPAVLQPKAPPLRTIWRQMPGGQKSAILVVLGALVAFLGFMLGRATGPTGTPTSAASGPASTPAASRVPSATSTWRLAQPEEIKLIDDALVAQTKGDYLTADKLLQQLSRQAPDLAGNQTALALLNLQKGDLINADFYIKRGIDAGEDAGRLYGLRGMIEMRLSHPRRANEAFEMAARSAPQDFKSFFLWAEYLRRIGKTQQALDRFDQAIARVHEQADEDVMQFKRRLTLIAGGRGKELEPEMQMQLSLNPPAGDWLLLAMAEAAQRDDFKTAAKYLERASQLMSQAALVDRLRDFYLYQWCYEKELAPFFQPLQKSLSTARSTEPVMVEGKSDEDEPAGAAPPVTPAPNKR